VFPNRAYFHTSIYCNRNSNIREPKGLEGKRFGTPEYQVTAAVWLRGALQHDFWSRCHKNTPGLLKDEKSCLMGETGFKPPARIEIYQIPPDETMISLLESESLDAVMPSPTLICNLD
jgi:4,5-dihydroxyphthalate decarboxylase